MAQEKETAKPAEMLQDLIGSENPMLQMMEGIHPDLAYKHILDS